MKKSVNYVLAALLSIAFFNPIQLNADPINGFKKLVVKATPSGEGKSFELRIANLEKEFTKVKILDIWGYTLYSEYVNNKNGYSKLVGLNNLPKGDYLLHIDHPSGTSNHAFHLGNMDVTFFEATDGANGFSRFTGHNHVNPNVQGQFSAGPHNLKMQLEGLSGGQVNIHVCNLQGKLFFKKKMKGQQSLAMDYSTKKLPEGEFMLVVRTDEKTIIQPFGKSPEGVELKNVLVSTTASTSENMYTNQ